MCPQTLFWWRRRGPTAGLTSLSRTSVFLENPKQFQNPQPMPLSLHRKTLLGKEIRCVAVYRMMFGAGLLSNDVRVNKRYWTWVANCYDIVAFSTVMLELKLTHSVDTGSYHQRSPTRPRGDSSAQDLVLTRTYPKYRGHCRQHHPRHLKMWHFLIIRMGGECHKLC